MNRLFDNEHHRGETLATEMIDIQVNDYIVPTLNALFKRLIDTAYEIRPNNMKALMFNKDLRTIVREIDQALTKRFGFNITQLGVEDGMLGVYTAPPKGYNMLSPDKEGMYDRINGLLNKTDKTDKNTLAAKDITIFERDYKDMFYRWRASMDALEKSLNSKGIRIDLKNAKIIGMPDDYNIFIVVNYITLIAKVKLNAEELTAIFLHEIGHAFTHIEYSYRTVRNTSVIIDTIKENAIDRGRPYKETMLLIYNKISDNPVKNIEKASLVTVTIAVVDEYLKSFSGFTESNYDSIDSEQLADQFSTRFGVGAHSVSALYKIHLTYPGYADANQNWLAASIPISLMGVLYGAIVMVLAGPAGAIVIGLAIAMFVRSISVVNTTAGGTSQAMIYDTDKRRILRIRNEMIRAIRSSKLDKKIIEPMLYQLEYIKIIINRLPEETTTINNKIYRFFSTNAKRNINITQIEQIVEDLMENELHVSAAIVKNLNVKGK